MRNRGVILALLIGAFGVALTVFFLKVRLTPEVASAEGEPIERLLLTLFIIGGLVFALCLVTLLFSVAVFRRRPGDTEDGPPIEGHTGLELTWSLIPLAIVIGLAVYGARVLGALTG